MTDKDILERLKNYVAECRKDGFPMLRADVALIFFDEAIQEVEKLREALMHETTSLQTAANKHLKKQIESLTSELEEAKTGFHPAWSEKYKKLEQELEAVKAEREMAEEVAAEKGMELEKVSDELKEFKSKLEEAVSLNDYEKLEAQLEVAEKERDLFKDLHYLCASDEIIKAYNRLEIFKSELEAENKELKKWNQKYADENKKRGKEIAELKEKCRQKDEAWARSHGIGPEVIDKFLESIKK